MEFIKSLIPVIDTEKFRGQIEDSRQLSDLFEMICNGNVSDEEDARARLYGPSGSILAFKKLKQRLRDKLTEYVLLNGITYRNLDEYVRGYRKCMTQAMAVKTLSLSNAKIASVNIGENLIKTTLANEYMDLTILIARELYTYFTSIDFHPIKSKKYERILVIAQDVYSKELEANKYYCELRHAFNTARGALKDKALGKAILYCDKLRPYLAKQETSYQLLFHIYSVIAMRFELEQDYHQLLQICDEATQTLSGRKITRRAGLYQFDVYKIVCFIQLHEYQKATTIAESYFKVMTRSSLNWFVLKTYVIVCMLHSKNYQGAYEIVEEVRNDKAYGKLPNAILQSWIVYEAHVEFLISIGKIKAGKNSKFRLYRFLNEIPIFTRDKRGLNIAILIVHVLILLEQRKYTQIIDRVDALNQYCHRHLRRDDTFRSNCFIKMLLQIPRADFNRQRTERYSLPFYRKLKSMPLVISDQSIEVEIIPYEELWNMVLSLLD